MRTMQHLSIAATLLACGGRHDTPLAFSDPPLGDSASSSSTTPTVGGDSVSPVYCSSNYANGGGGLMVDPPRSCDTIWSSCTDDQIYMLSCDGMSCTCIVDGFPQATPSRSGYPNPRCPDLPEAAAYCAWPIRFPPGSYSGSGPAQGQPCGDPNALTDRSCECVDGISMCTGSGGCNAVGNYQLAGAEGSLHFLADGAFYLATLTPTATLDEVMQGQARGWYGTWQLNAEILSVRSSGDLACEGPGRYLTRFDADCRLVTLELLEDDCVERRVLATSLSAE